MTKTSTRKKTQSSKKTQARKNPNFERIMRGLDEATAYTRGEADTTKYRVHVPDAVNVAAIRSGLGLTQEKFAARFGFSKGAVRDWEQGRKVPEARARILLNIIEKRPDIVFDVLSAA
jgi:putative transcriptional regulator